MIIDEKGKLFGKVNVIDICVALVVVAACAVLFIKLGGSSSGDSREVTITYYCEEVVATMETGEYIKPGDLVYDDAKNVALGSVVSVSYDESAYYAPNVGGVMVKSPKEGYRSAVIVAKVKAQPFSNGVIIAGNKYMVGHSATIRAGYGKLWIRIIEINTAPEGLEGGSND